MANPPKKKKKPTTPQEKAKAGFAFGGGPGIIGGVIAPGLKGIADNMPKPKRKKK